MWQLLTGSLILSAIHASIPNHWIPLIAVGKAEKWGKGETLFATFITGFAHTLSTVIIGVFIGIAGYRLSDNYSLITRVIAPLILILLGIVYLITDLIQSRHHHHAHSHFNLKDKKIKVRSKWTILLSLGIAMFFSPCAEIEAYFFQAGTQGWPGIVLVSTVYTITTVLFMMLLVYLGMRSLKKIKSHYLEHHAKQVTGIVLVALGVMAFFVSF